jgi:hypothetical protein
MRVAEIIRRAIEIGERNGRITFGELDRVCRGVIQPEEIELQPEEIDRILHALSEAEIHLDEQ